MDYHKVIMRAKEDISRKLIPPFQSLPIPISILKIIFEVAKDSNENILCIHTFCSP